LAPPLRQTNDQEARALRRLQYARAPRLDEDRLGRHSGELLENERCVGKEPAGIAFAAL
jgi:hypothetical protein